MILFNIFRFINKRNFFVASCLANFNFICLSCISTKAQLVPDSSNGNTHSTIIPNQIIDGQNSDLVTGGEIRGELLFHSFQNFNVNNGSGVYFANPQGISNILTRVTGSSSSNILGKLGVLGPANLLIINPNGFIFGSNAQLNITGSFLASTATSINLSEGALFSATNPQPVPLLTVRVPLGLKFTGNSGPIQVLGTGHTLSSTPAVGIITLPNTIGAGESTTGLRVQPGKTIALIGGNVDFDGGILSTPSGRIEIGSIGLGEVNINTVSDGWNLDYKNVYNFQDINISNLSLLDASGPGRGNIQIQGKQVNLSNGSFALIQNQGVQPSGEIKVNASTSLNLLGTTYNPSLNTYPANATTRSGLISETLIDQGANINISSPEVVLESGGGIITNTLVSGLGGNILINAPNSIKVSGFSPVAPINDISTILSATFGSANSGEIQISTNNLFVQNGGSILSLTVGSGRSGNLMLNIYKSVNITGINPFLMAGTQVATSSFGNGNSGNLLINTENLRILNGGKVGSAIAANGSSGNVTINANDSIVISGSASNSSISSVIDSSGDRINPVARLVLGLPEVPSGNSGNIILDTQKLAINDTGRVSVRNEGTGNAGILKITANSVKIDNQGSITAATTSGEGGLVTIETQDLQLRRNSSITADTGGTGNARNLTIITDTLTALENSDITANASQGKGGDVQINTQGLFQSSDSEITADSELGIDGVVEITTLETDVENNLTPLEAKFISPEQLIAGSCLTRRNERQGSFVVTGTGGLPSTPYSNTQEYDSLTGNEAPQAETLIPQPVEEEPTQSKWKSGDPIVEATALVRTNDGEVLLVAQQTDLQDARKLVCTTEKNR